MSCIEWLQRTPDATARVFCFPCAGGGPTAFRPWRGRIPRHVDLVAIQLPGRERRSSERCHTHLDAVVAELKLAITPHLDVPYVFFGHSLGAIVAYRLLCELRELGLVAPQLLVVAACVAPQMMGENDRMATLSDTEFLALMQSYGGTPAELFADRQFVAVLMQRLRADFQVFESFAYQPIEPFAFPILEVHGDADPFVPTDRVAAWGDLTIQCFEQRGFPGGHFFVNHHGPVLAALTTRPFTSERYDQDDSKRDSHPQAGA